MVATEAVAVVVVITHRMKGIDRTDHHKQLILPAAPIMDITIRMRTKMVWIGNRVVATAAVAASAVVLSTTNSM